MKKFDIPVVLIFFNRPYFFEKLLRQIAKVKPSKLYLISDGARPNRFGEDKLVQESRDLADKLIDWPCTVIKNYAEENKGCCDRIAGGAKWVFSMEETAIFLEDDNIPDLTFFPYCKELLERYYDNKDVFWICGGNYLVNYKNKEESSYIFSRHMYPCGWASWRRAFSAYDEAMSNWFDLEIRKEVLSKIRNPSRRIDMEYIWGYQAALIRQGNRPTTWDVQWSFLQYQKNGLSIVPCHNLIHNIGIDARSTHGVTKMTRYAKRLLMLDIIPIDFPLIHPKTVALDDEYDDRVDRLLILPNRFKFWLAQVLKKIFRLNPYMSLTEQLQSKYIK